MLFCSLTEEQREIYKQYLRSDDISFIIHDRREGGRYRARLLVALTALRKICNHPDLFLYADNNKVVHIYVDESYSVILYISQSA